MKAGLWLFVLAAGLTAAAPSDASENRETAIDTLDAKDVHRLLQSWSLSAIADCLLSEEVDGDTLAHSTKEDFADSVANCPAARTHQWRKLWRKLERARMESEGRMVVELPPASAAFPAPATTQVLNAAQRARRSLVDEVLMNFGGVQINRNNSMVSFGTEQDVVLYRDGPGSLTVKGNLRQLTPAGDVSLSDIETLAEQVQALSEKLDRVVSNVTTLQIHDYVYNWFQDVRTDLAVFIVVWLSWESAQPSLLQLTANFCLWLPDWFCELQGWFTIPANHESSSFSTGTHGLDGIECDAAHRGMFFYDVTGNQDGVCVCACEDGNQDYAWFVFAFIVPLPVFSHEGG